MDSDRDVAGNAGMTRSKWLVAGVVAALVIVGGVSWYVLRDDRPAAKAGTVFTASDLPIHPTAISYLIAPWGRLDIGVTKARDDLPRAVDTRDHRAPDGGSFIGVQWQIDAHHLLPVPRTPSSGIEPAVVSIVVDGHRYRVGDTRSTSAESGDGVLVLDKRQAYVAVPGSSSDIRIEVSFAGVRQTLDPRTGRRQTGRAAPLYTLDTGKPKQTCGTARWPAQYRPARRDARCLLKYLARVPYVDGLGWAPRGRSWLVMTVATKDPSDLTWTSPTSGARLPYTVGQRGTEHAYRYAGAAPAAVIDLNALPGLHLADPDRPDQAIFSIAASPGAPKPLTVTAAVHGRAVADTRPKGAEFEPTVPVTWTIAVG